MELHSVHAQLTIHIQQFSAPHTSMLAAQNDQCMPSIAHIPSERTCTCTHVTYARKQLTGWNLCNSHTHTHTQTHSNTLTHSNTNTHTHTQTHTHILKNSHALKHSNTSTIRWVRTYMSMLAARKATSAWNAHIPHNRGMRKQQQWS